MKKLDYRKELKAWYQPPVKAVVVVEVPSARFLMIDGQGDPNTSPAYAAAVEALFAVSYAIKFMVKRGARAIDYGVMPLEGLWWADDMAAFFTADKARWRWTMMIMQPAIVDAALVAAALEDVRRKKNLAALEDLLFEAMAEGRAAQIMHLGPFSAEGPAIERVHAYIAAQGGKLSGKHHEIYLSDIRKAASAKWRTVIRQPFC